MALIKDADLEVQPQKVVAFHQWTERGKQSLILRWQAIFLDINENISKPKTRKKQ